MKKKAAKKSPKKSSKSTAIDSGIIAIPPPEMIRRDSINLAAYNPRVMPPEKMRALKASLRRHGLVLNLVVQRKADNGITNVLVGGHQRIDGMEQIAKEDKLALPEVVPAVVLDLTDAEAKKLNVALNKIEGEFDPYRLGEVFASIREELTVEDVLMTGFTLEEVDQAIVLALPVEEQIAGIERELDEVDLGAFAKSITLTVEFETVEQRDDAKERLKALALAESRKPGSVLLDAIKAREVQRPRKRSK